MVNMKTIVALICLAVAVQANTPATEKFPLPAHVKSLLATNGAQYSLFEKFIEGINLSNEDREATFTGLNAKTSDDQKIGKDDLKTFYWYNELEYAVEKFMTFIEGQGDKKITKAELNKALGKENDEVEVALIECHYLKSKGLKQSCFADQLLTYAALVLDNTDVQSFFKDGSGADDKLTKEEVQKWVAKVQDKKNTYDPDIALEELGAHSGNEVTLTEFKKYVTQETLNDDFRRCRKSPPSIKDGNVDYKNDCLLEELVEYINDDLTDLDIAVLFRAVDIDGKGTITLDEIQKLPGGAKDKADKIMTLLDMSLTSKDLADKDRVVDFGEFRTYMRSPTVLVQLERKCTEKKKLQSDELDCLFDLFVRLVTQEHDAIWLVVPDLEQTIAFEILDTDVKTDGIITEAELTFKDDGAKKKFISEIDTDDEGTTVDLEEFNEYMDIPHMVYGTGDCLLKKNNVNGRGACYPSEIEKIFTNIKDVTNEFLQEWFNSYDDNRDGLIEVSDKNESPDKFGSKDLEKLFLNELGQGDDTVTQFEFEWYVKQQELAEQYHDNFDGSKPKLNKFHEDLKKWIEDYVTEYDVQKFFAELDTNHDHELSKEDFKDIWGTIETLIKTIDGFGNDIDDKVNFREFWLWLNAPSNKPDQKLIKHILQKECTERHKGDGQQEKEIDCYVETFKKKPNLLTPGAV